MRSKALLFVLGLFSLLVVAAFYPFEVDELGRTVLERARESTGIPLAASRSRFRIWEGLSIEEVSGSVPTALGRYDVELERILFGHRPLSLLTGRLELSRVHLERPRVSVTLGVGTARGPEPESASRPSSSIGLPARERTSAGAASSKPPPSRVVLAPSEIRMTSAEFLVGERFSLRGVDVLLERFDYDRRAITALHALSSEATVGIAEAELGSFRLRNLSANMVTDNGRLTLEGLRVSIVYGELRGSFTCDFNVIPFRYRASVVAEPIRIQGLGEGVLRLDAEGFGTESRHMSGSGTFELAPGAVPDLPFLRELHPGLARQAHRGARAEIDLRDNVVRVHGMRFETAALGLDVEGALELDGELDLVLTLHEGESRRTYRLGGRPQAPELTRRD